MYEPIEKSKENNSRAVTNFIPHRKNKVKQGYGFVNNRHEAIAQRKLQEMADNSPQAVAYNYSSQKLSDSSKMVEFTSTQKINHRSCLQLMRKFSSSNSLPAMTNTPTLVFPKRYFNPSLLGSLPARALAKLDIGSKFKGLGLHPDLHRPRRKGFLPQIARYRFQSGHPHTIFGDNNEMEGCLQKGISEVQEKLKKDGNSEKSKTTSLKFTMDRPITFFGFNEEREFQKGTTNSIFIKIITDPKNKDPELRMHIITIYPIPFQ